MDGWMDRCVGEKLVTARKRESVKSISESEIKTEKEKTLSLSPTRWHQFNAPMN